jgi:hypothetical protein
MGLAFQMTRCPDDPISRFFHNPILLVAEAAWHGLGIILKLNRLLKIID